MKRKTGKDFGPTSGMDVHYIEQKVVELPIRTINLYCVRVLKCFCVTFDKIAVRPIC